MENKYIHREPGELIKKNSDHIEVAGHYGKWFVVDSETHNGHETHGDSAAHIIVDCHGTIILEDVWNGFADYYESLEEPPSIREKKMTKETPCIYFQGIEDCACNNPPDNPGECIYERGIEPEKPAIKCRHYKGR
jgi:hypothetical protein